MLQTDAQRQMQSRSVLLSVSGGYAFNPDNRRCTIRLRAFSIVSNFLILGLEHSFSGLMTISSAALRAMPLRF
jgi:hypothetical protein